MLRIIFVVPKILSLIVLFFILSVMVILFKYIKKWRLVQWVSKVSVRLCRFTCKVTLLRNWAYNNMEKINKFLDFVFIFCPIQNVCTERMLVSSLVYSFIGVKTKMVLGVRFKPALMHIWLEDEEGHVVIDSPQDRNLFMKIGEVEKYATINNRQL